MASRGRLPREKISLPKQCGRAILNPEDGIGDDLLNTAPSRTNRPSTAETGVDEEELIDAGGLPEAAPDAAHMMMLQFLGGLATEQQTVDQRTFMVRGPQHLFTSETPYTQMERVEFARGICHAGNVEEDVESALPVVLKAVATGGPRRAKHRLDFLRVTLPRAADVERLLQCMPLAGFDVAWRGRLGAEPHARGVLIARRGQEQTLLARVGWESDLLLSSSEHVWKLTVNGCDFLPDITNEAVITKFGELLLGLLLQWWRHGSRCALPHAVAAPELLRARPKYVQLLASQAPSAVGIALDLDVPVPPLVLPAELEVGRAVTLYWHFASVRVVPPTWTTEAHYYLWI